MFIVPRHYMKTETCGLVLEHLVELHSSQEPIGDLGSGSAELLSAKTLGNWPRDLFVFLQLGEVGPCLIKFSFEVCLLAHLLDQVGELLAVPCLTQGVAPLALLRIKHLDAVLAEMLPNKTTHPPVAVTSRDQVEKP